MEDYEGTTSAAVAPPPLEVEVLETAGTTEWAPQPVVFPLDRPLAEVPSLWGRFFRDLARGIAVLLMMHFFLVQVSVVRGHSMQPSLKDGDRLVVDRLTHQLAGIDRFDVVVLRYPKDPTVDFVKRVVGLPGDLVRLDRRGLWVNGQLVEQAFGHVDDVMPMAARRVPEGHYFVLGDNRPISCDSREFGMVSADLVRGTVRVRFWPLERVSVF